MKKAKLLLLLLVVLLILMILDFDADRLSRSAGPVQAGYEQNDSVSPPNPADTQPNIEVNGR